MNIKRILFCQSELMEFRWLKSLVYQESLKIVETMASMPYN